jgi:hypothetical protein
MARLAQAENRLGAASHTIVPPHSENRDEALRDGHVFSRGLSIAGLRGRVT